MKLERILIAGAILISSLAIGELTPARIENRSIPHTQADGSLAYDPVVCLKHRVRQGVNGPIDVSCAPNLFKATLKYFPRELSRAVIRDTSFLD